jgi:hypothetical protein
MVSGLLWVLIGTDFPLAVCIEQLFYGLPLLRALLRCSKEGRLAGCSALRRFRLTPALCTVARACQPKRRCCVRRRREEDASTQLPAVSSFPLVICEAMELTWTIRHCESRSLGYYQEFHGECAPGVVMASGRTNSSVPGHCAGADRGPARLTRPRQLGSIRRGKLRDRFFSVSGYRRRRRASAFNPARWPAARHR